MQPTTTPWLKIGSVRAYQLHIDLAWFCAEARMLCASEHSMQEEREVRKELRLLELLRDLTAHGWRKCAWACICVCVCGH